ncbi:MAG: glycosyltransferase family 92 protein [Pseudomonadota bacterium]
MAGPQFDERDCLYDLAIGCVFQDEAPYLREWIEFHLHLGVQHFLLVNDRSNDNYQSVLGSYVDAGVVTLLESPCPEDLRGKRWPDYQRGLYASLCKETAGQVRWLALIDVDEFLVPGTFGRSIPQVLGDFEGIGAVYVRWEPFGTSYLPRLDPGRPMIDQLRLKWRFRAGHEMLGKSIVKPHCVSRANIHLHELLPGCATHDLNPGMRYEEAELKLYHYWSRDEQYLFDVKLPRSGKIKGWDLDEIGEDYFKNLFNEVEDGVMPDYAKIVQRRLEAVL